ncbi:MAG: EamA family transporter [Planctomycetia bacterium]
MTMSLPTGSVTLGIAAGLLSGACMSFSYLLSRHHALGYPAEDRPEAAIGLLFRSHVVMGLIALPAVAWLWPAGMPSVDRYILPLLAAAGLYFLGNILLFGLLRRVEASRLTPFLGLKVFMLAVIVAVFLGRPLTATQWTAVTLSVAATALLQGTAGGLPARALGRILLVCLCFAVSDLFIVRLIDVLDLSTVGNSRRLTAAVLGMLLTYVACGASCGVVLLTGRFRPPARLAWPAWRTAATYAGTWLLAMAGLYICFGLVGAVFGNVVQSTRGIMSVVIGAVLAHLGWHELEQQVDRATLVRRIGAACLMTAAIAVYVL